VFDAFVVPPELRLVAERDLGVAECLFGDCAHIDRYYVTDRPVEEICGLLTSSMLRWGLVAVAPSPSEGCRWEGRIGRELVQAFVRRDAHIDSYGSEPIVIPHAAVLVVSAARR